MFYIKKYFHIVFLTLLLISLISSFFITFPIKLKESDINDMVNKNYTQKTFKTNIKIKNNNIPIIINFQYVILNLNSKKIDIVGTLKINDIEKTIIFFNDFEIQKNNQLEDFEYLLQYNNDDIKLGINNILYFLKKEYTINKNNKDLKIFKNNLSNELYKNITSNISLGIVKYINDEFNLFNIKPIIFKNIKKIEIQKNYLILHFSYIFFILIILLSYIILYFLINISTFFSKNKNYYKRQQTIRKKYIEKNKSISSGFLKEERTVI